jgi:hypothetical protein
MRPVVAPETILNSVTGTIFNRNHFDAFGTIVTDDPPFFTNEADFGIIISVLDAVNNILFNLDALGVLNIKELLTLLAVEQIRVVKTSINFISHGHLNTFILNSVQVMINITRKTCPRFSCFDTLRDFLVHTVIEGI